MPVMSEHQLFKTGDRDAPEIIIDSSGQVALGLCRVCGAAERELDEVPHCPGRRLREWDVRYPISNRPRFGCVSCGSWIAGPMLHNRLWDKVCVRLGIRKHHHACPKCMEKALARRLTLGDLRRHGGGSYPVSFFHLEHNRPWVEALAKAEIAKVQLGGHLSPAKEPQP